MTKEVPNSQAQKPTCMADLVKLPKAYKVTPMVYAMACKEIDKRELISKR